MKTNHLDLRCIHQRLERIERASLAQKKVLTLKEACHYTSFSTSYMYKLTSAGIIPHFKPNGKTIFFDREQLDRWLLSNGRTSWEEKETAAATYVSSERQ